MTTTRIYKYIFVFFLSSGYSQAHAFISYVQLKENSASANTNTIASGGFGSATTSGNLVVCSIRYASTTESVSSVTDTASNTYVKAIGPTTGAASLATRRNEIWYSYNITGQVSMNVTATMSNTFNALKVINCIEYSGAVSAFDPLDGTAANTGISVTELSSGTISTTQAGDLIFGRCLSGTKIFAMGWSIMRSTESNQAVLDRVNVGPVGNYDVSCQNFNGGADILVQAAAFKAVSNSPGAGISLVQGKTKRLTNVSLTSIATSFEANNSAGNFIVVGYRMSGNGRTLTVSDTIGNTYNLVDTIDQTTDGHQIWIYYAMNIGGGANTVTASATGAGALNLTLHIAEYRGVAITSALDKTAKNIASSSSVSSGATATTTSADQLLIGMLGLSGAGSTGDLYTPTSGFTYRSVSHNSSDYMNSGFIDRVVSSTGTYAATATLPSSHDWSAIIATFHADTTTAKVRHRVTTDEP